MQAFGAALAGAQRIVIATHARQDPDTLGSALGLAAILRGIGKDVTIVSPPPPPMRFAYMPGFDTIEFDLGKMDALKNSADMFVGVDASTMNQLGSWGPLATGVRAAGKPVINIDHHDSSDHYGTVNIVVPTAAANGELAYRVARALDLPVPPDAAASLYRAILGDTAGFRHSSTTSTTLGVAADLAKAGADPGALAAEQFSQTTLAQKRFTLEILSRARQYGDLTVATVPRDAMKRYGLGGGDGPIVIDDFNSLGGWKVLVVLFEKTHGTTMSIRTRGDYNALDIASVAPGGGGHVHAAGGKLDLPLATATALVTARARQVVEATSVNARAVA